MGKVKLIFFELVYGWPTVRDTIRDTTYVNTYSDLKVDLP